MKKRIILTVVLMLFLVCTASLSALGEEKNPGMTVIREDEKKDYNGEFIEDGEITIDTLSDGLTIERVRTGSYEEDGDYVERLVFDISGRGLPGTSVKSYNYPQTMVLSLAGARWYGEEFWNSITDEKIISGEIETRYLKKVYSIITMDDSAMRFGLEFREDVEFKVFYLYDPLRIVIDCRTRKMSEEETGTLYSLRTETFEHGEIIGGIESSFRWSFGSKNSRMMEIHDGRVFVEEGIYKDYKKALKRKSEIEKMLKNHNRECEMFIVEIGK